MKKPKKIKQTLCSLVASALLTAGGCIEQHPHAERDRIIARALYKLQTKQGIIEEKSEFTDPKIEKIYDINWDLVETDKKYRDQKNNGIIEGQDKWKHYEQKRAKKFYQTEWFSLGIFVIAQFLDFYTSKLVINNGGTETNPFLGRHPSNDKLLAFKIAVILQKVLLDPKPKSLKIQDYYLGAGIAGAASLWNDHVYEDIK